MKCKNCQEEISPKFAHAISNNCCPMCGKEIMDAALKDLFGNLIVVFENAKNYMTEVQDWLFTNFSMKVIKDTDIVIDKLEYDELVAKTKFPAKNIRLPEEGEVSEENNKIASGFANRAGVKPIHKKAIDFIKGQTSGAADPSEFVGIDDEYGEVNLMEDQQNNLKPIGNQEKNMMSNLFDNPQDVEIEKLKKLKSQRNFASGGGKFSRE